MRGGGCCGAVDMWISPRRREWSVARWTAPALGCGAEDRAQSGLDIGDLGEFLLDQTNHLRADRHTTGGTQQLETTMKRVGRSRT